MFVSVRNRLPDRLVPSRLRNRYLATEVTRRRFIRQALSITAAAAIALAVVSVVRSAERTRTGWGQSDQILVAAHAISAGAQLGTGDIRTQDTPIALIPDNAIRPDGGSSDGGSSDRRGSDSGSSDSGGSDVIGLHTVAGIDSGEAITTSKLATGRSNPFLSRLTTRRSALTVSVGEESLAVADGDTVDVYGPSSGNAGMGAAGLDYQDFVAVRRLARHAVVLDVSRLSVTLSVASDEVLDVLASASGGPVALVLPG